MCAVGTQACNELGPQIKIIPLIVQEQLWRNVVKLGTSISVVPGTLTGDISQLHVIQNFNGGYVFFTGGDRGKINKKGTIVNGVLSFENVIDAPELKYSLLSVSQISL